MSRSPAETRARVEKSLRGRYWAERRFRAYGLGAVLLGVLFVVFLFGTIISKGLPAFRQAQVTIEITYDPAIIDPEGKRAPEALASADYAAIVRASLRARFPDAEGRVAGRKVMGLVSNSAASVLQKRVIDDPKRIGTKERVTVLASDDVDQLLKGRIDRTAPQEERPIDDQQLAWIDALQKDDALSLRFNTVFFTNGEEQPHAIKSLPARFDASGLATEQFEATSKDGTKIPYFVTRPKKLNGPAPTVLYGYGGFEVSLTPGYSANFGRQWLTHGGIYVVANIRGGGEFGPAWHEAAVKKNRQRAYDDFAAVAQDLIKRGLTTPKQLGIMGGSNGGLLVSAVMVQHPELFGAVVCQVPLVDMIAYMHIGAGASWEGEYGDPAKPDERAYLLTYSPYQNVKKGVKYPPVFFVTATSDDRVTPVHARKMAARMEEQGHEVLFYENTDGGHSAAADHKQSAEMWGLSFVYLAEKLGLKS